MIIKQGNTKQKQTKIKREKNPTKDTKKQRKKLQEIKE